MNCEYDFSLTQNSKNGGGKKSKNSKNKADKVNGKYTSRHVRIQNNKREKNNNNKNKKKK